MKQKNKALVVFSGGADSTICLHWAMKKFGAVEAITFDYGQRHKIEIDAAVKICELNNIPQKIVEINSFAQLGDNALTNESIKIDASNKGQLPNTFVPGRNLIFLTMAAAWAHNRNISELVTGVCQTDFSGYPDCRDETIQALQKSISLGMDCAFQIHTPLMFITKAESIQMAHELDGFDSLALSHTCYEGKSPPCGQCPSCVLRQKGFDEAGFTDPIYSQIN